MAVLLVILGVLGVAAGAAMVAFGVPVKEFSLGNTLIMAGTTAVMGGLIVVGLGVVARRLQALADLLAMRPLQPGRPGDLPGLLGTAPRLPAAGRVPFPPRPKPELKPELKPEPRPEPPGAADRGSRPFPPEAIPALTPEPIERNVFQPMLRDEPPVPPELDDTAPPALQPGVPPPPLGVEPKTAGEEASLPPPVLPPLRDSDEPDGPGFPVPPRDLPRRDNPERTFVFSQSSFEAVWHNEPAPEPRLDMPEDAPVEPAREPETVRRVATPPAASPGEPRPVAILKSGVVDGMGYTLYVDGSIEAELPQGTARFASIAELREHLEKNTAKVPDSD